MPDHRHRFPRALAEAFRIDGHRAPVRDRQAGAREGLGDDRPSALVPLEKDRHGKIAQEAMRDLDQEARAVSALAVGVEATPVGKAGQRLDPESDCFMAELGRGHKAHAASRPPPGHISRPGAARGSRCRGHYRGRLPGFLNTG